MKQSIFILVILAVLLISCGKSEKSFKVNVEPTSRIMNKLNGTDYSIVLNDMDMDKKNDLVTYKHKYHILKKVNDSLIIDSLDWKPVNKSFFVKYQDDLGMEIISNHNGKLSLVSQPVGYGWAVGNSTEGQWVKVDSTKTNSRRVWRPHGTSMLFWYWMLRRPSYQRDYMYSQRYRSAGSVYYGGNTNGTSSKFGTQSTYQKSKRGSFYSRSKSSSTWKSFRKSRSSSRYGNSSSTRSRSGGSGK